MDSWRESELDDVSWLRSRCEMLDWDFNIVRKDFGDRLSFCSPSSSEVSSDETSKMDSILISTGVEVRAIGSSRSTWNLTLLLEYVL